ncbi:GNAT family N-acetyltransferase [Tamlana sp. s12]|uniref:GNAT family N-acetyltransferase n=1 Tax=Tamlana sp. s12 TaxID=1630406 RepID=UPI0007FD7D20|nr:GNAT family N-acetyltransferase [Tamlana sp. s12]OBQ52907.1 GNAT family acetyltransferase [Tamlana sp. s12]QQY81213.1 GNAT family N-acetyltransferase [Tamlana sp. s12]
MVEFCNAENTTDYILIEGLADIIWREHYIPIVGKPQIDYMLDKFQSAEAIAQQVENGFQYYTMVWKTRAVGYLAIREEPDALFLSKIYILKTFRGQNIGKQAIYFVESMARKCDRDKMRLTVNIHNSNAIKAYENMGFNIVRPLVVDIGQGFVMDDYEMSKRVDRR